MKTFLCYRGSRDGWMSNNFHSLSDNKGPTLTLFKIKNGDCIGGYTSAKWESERKYSSDSEAFLFNLT